MKFDLTIKDATQQEVARVLNLLNGDNAPANAAVTVTNNTPAPVAAAPTPVAVAPAPVADADEETGSVESDGSGVDAGGLPWDARIHSSNKKKSAKGVWVRRRGVDENTFNHVKNEILQQLSVPVAAAPIPPMTVAPAPVQQYAASPTHAIAPAPAPVPAPQPVPMAVAPAPAPVQVQAAPVAVAPARDFNAVLSRVQAGFVNKRIDQNYLPGLIARINQHHGVTLTAIPEIAGQQHLVDTAHAFMDQDTL